MATLRLTKTSVLKYWSASKTVQRNTLSTCNVSAGALTVVHASIRHDRLQHNKSRHKAYNKPLSIRAMSSRSRGFSTTVRRLSQSNDQIRLEDNTLGVCINGNLLTFPFVWLRDNCQCEKCWHPVSKQRLLHLQELDLSIIPKFARQENGQLFITWPDDHESVYTESWLKHHSFERDDVDRRRKQEESGDALWGSELQNKIPTTDFQKMLEDDDVFLKWLVSMETVGLHLLVNVPGEGALKQIGKRVYSGLRSSNYGDLFHVKAKKDPSNLAYTAGLLEMHTDLAYYHYVPGMQMLHCVIQTHTVGGDNNFVDGFNVASQMAQLHPEDFQSLTTSPVVFHDIGEDAYPFHLRTSKPTIVLDEDQKVQQINFSNFARHSIMNMTVDEAVRLYKAMKVFHAVAYDDRNIVKHKLNPGEIVCFHNFRVLHGRVGYEMIGGAERYLVGAYIDWDELKSCRRVISEKVGNK